MFQAKSSKVHSLKAWRWRQLYHAWGWRSRYQVNYCFCFLKLAVCPMENLVTIVRPISNFIFTVWGLFVDVWMYYNAPRKSTVVHEYFRGAYCAASAARLTNILTQDMFENTPEWIVGWVIHILVLWIICLWILCAVFSIYMSTHYGQC